MASVLLVFDGEHKLGSSTYVTLPSLLLLTNSSLGNHSSKTFSACSSLSVSLSSTPGRCKVIDDNHTSHSQIIVRLLRQYIESSRKDYLLNSWASFFFVRPFLLISVRTSKAILAIHFNSISTSSIKTATYATEEQVVNWMGLSKKKQHNVAKVKPKPQ
jgi:hypothetical protein